eukprot:9195747-Pyramimonas_sp.AAC.1
MSAWKLKWALGGDRLDFECYIGFVHADYMGERATRVRALSRSASLVASTIGKSPCWLGN